MDAGGYLRAGGKEAQERESQVPQSAQLLSRAGQGFSVNFSWVGLAP